MQVVHTMIDGASTAEEGTALMLVALLVERPELLREWSKQPGRGTGKFGLVIRTLCAQGEALERWIKRLQSLQPDERDGASAELRTWLSSVLPVHVADRLHPVEKGGCWH